MKFATLLKPSSLYMSRAPFSNIPQCDQANDPQGVASLDPSGLIDRIYVGDHYVCVLRFYGPVNPMGSCRARSVYLTTRLLGRLSPLSS